MITMDITLRDKILEHNEGNNLIFHENEHKYYVNGEEFISVTTKKEKYFPFDAKKISREVAQRNWTTEEEVLEEWSTLAKNGSYIHILAEKYLNNELHDEELSKIGHVIKYFKDHPQFEIMATEVQIFSKKYKIAGTVDLIVRDMRNDRLFTIDWKTSRKEISRNDVWDMANTPFQFIANNKFYSYSIQLWAYNLILKEEYGIDIWDSFIIHLRDDLKSYTIIEPVQMLYEAEELLNLD